LYNAINLLNNYLTNNIDIKTKIYIYIWI
jgi:hypothetical protein